MTPSDTFSLGLGILCLSVAIFSTTHRWIRGANFFIGIINLLFAFHVI